MLSNTQITFRGIPHSNAVEENILKKVEKLDKFYGRILACRVIVEAEHHRRHKGNLYHVRIELDVPEKNIIVSRENHAKHAHEDIYVVVRDAFYAARRQLEDYARIQRGDVKSHQFTQLRENSKLYVNKD